MQKYHLKKFRRSVFIFKLFLKLNNHSRKRVVEYWTFLFNFTIPKKRCETTKTKRFRAE
jgi:hypothetical protein